jgi:murein DD-endopeptidase MepM/ murein hydrolase activator NlpD
MKGSRATIQIVLVIILIVSLTGVIYFYLEWEKPSITLDNPVSSIGNFRDVSIRFQDKRSGLRDLKVAIIQNKHEFVIASEQIPYKGTFDKTLSIKIVPRDLRIKDGEALLVVKATDFSPLRNTTEQQTKITVDSTPPRITLLTHAHNINPGGTCLAIYRVSKAVRTSGVKCGDTFFPGYLVQGQAKPYYVCYFAVPRDVNRGTPIAVTAQDRALNTAIAGIPFYIRSVRPFRNDTVTVGDSFVQQKTVEFQEQDTRLSGKSPSEVFAFVNTQIRKENDEKILSIVKKTDSKQNWQGIFLRMKNSAPRALFGDARTYVYQGIEQGTSVHLGVDLASTSQAPVEAANTGTVLFADFLGIYGNCVIIDHGQGISSLYAHLSSLAVNEGDPVSKGQVVRNTGATGFAGGDHLHFSMIVGGVFVDPKEWWDPHWIRDNVEKKFALARTL